MWMTLLFPHHLKLFVILLFILKNKYVAETIGHTNMSSCKPSFTPIIYTNGYKYGSSSNPYHDQIEYQNLVGALQY